MVDGQTIEYPLALNRAWPKKQTPKQCSQGTALRNENAVNIKLRLPNVG